MKTFALIVCMLLSLVGFSQTPPNVDTISFINISSHKQSFSKSFTNLTKRNKDIVLMIDVTNKEMIGFVNAKPYMSCVISQYNIDSTGHLHIHGVMKSKRKTSEFTICYTIGDSFFTLVGDKGVETHTNVNYQLYSR